ncbi:Hsp20/alpha crystallin family protein [Mesobacillus foraminis]|uniref:Hsp20/alpha crystallin family protein n=1 Tax=Mesobacillus foraminis TaxID=279826 RepID=UPI0039A3B017
MFPWNLHEGIKKRVENMNPEEIDKYVQSMVAKMFPQNMEGVMNPQEWLKGIQGLQPDPGQAESRLNASVFETHEFVFIRIPIKDDAWLKNMKILHTSNQAIIKNIPQSGEQHTIPLPAIVKKKGAIASHRDGILEIKLPRSFHTQISEINVPDI